MKEHLTGSVDNLKLRFDSPQYAAMILKGLDGKRFEMEIGPEETGVRKQQHRYYRKCVVEPLQIFLRGCGYDCTTDDVHGILATRFLTSYLINPATGEYGDSYVKSTSKLTVRTMAEYIDKCIQYIVETYRIPIEEADKDWRSKKK
jgi:hypothetical protein